MTDNRYLSVQSLTKYIKRKFDADPHLTDVYVRGELSNFKEHSSGHMYFTLKDEKARLLAVMFSAHNRQLKFKPESGMKVLLQGEVSVYESGGQYQIYVKKMRPDGIGELFLAYEQLKKSLEQEGLFEPSRKKALPRFPEVIGVITSPTGAAVRDIITTIERRYPVAKVLIIPATVQGDQAAPSIVRGIERANALDKIDVLIVGRGGGSIEELWAFNEEIVARAIAESQIPIISAVGHETDFTIVDFISDMRAPTPTGAAEIAVPHIKELEERINQSRRRLSRSLNEKVKESKVRLKNIEQSYVFRNPNSLYAQKIEKLDRLNEKLKGEYLLKVKNLKDNLIYIQKRLERQHPNTQLQSKSLNFERISNRLHHSMKVQWRSHTKDFEKLVGTLDALSPLKILERGYSVVYSEEEQIVKSKQQVTIGESVTLELSDGTLKCEVKEVKEKKRS
ncbi:exodeoxyribonuclease VII large subunit [Bacillus sp. 2205SS5-2]|uniref:exodeoxyribonuclease VII large subunit n=1 Tax=Bacillus sp. 2205SS5-2 TaxID=3109031 RepID=UPI003003A8D5